MPNSSGFSRRQIARAFQQHGLAVEAAAVDAMRNILAREETEPEQVLEELLCELRERSLTSHSASGGVRSRSKIVSAELLAQVVADWSRSGKDAADEALQLLDAFSMPRLHYDNMRQQFSLILHEKRSLFGQATDKVDMLLQRYALIHQRILRQELFRPQLAGAARDYGPSVAHKITPVESLLGTQGLQLLLGMIVQVEEGRFYLEDPTAQVPIRLAGASVLTDGFITESSIVLVEGEFLDGILHIHRLGNPLIETRGEAMEAMGLQSSDLFQSLSTLAEVQKIQEQEVEHGPDRMFVILSDIHLDQPQVWTKLETLLDGFCQVGDDDPTLPVFVFMGNFSSVPLTSQVMMGHFDELATLISKFPRLAAEARFVLVPGPHDSPAGMGSILPRPPLPQNLTASLRTKVRHCHLASNPCRLRYFSKEIVLFRHDLVHSLWRHSLLRPRDGATEIQHTIKTILDQGHLCPVPLISEPVYWQLDHSLRLYPLPDAIVCGDRVTQYFENYADCDAINPGPFHKDFSFVVYRPVAAVDVQLGQTKSEVEFSQING